MNTASAEVSGAKKIPIRNIWVLMLYASDFLQFVNKNERKAIEDNPDDIPELVGKLLVHCVQKRLQRNLNFSYRRREAVLNRVRGRIDLLKTECKLLLQRGQVACKFEEMIINTPRNCYVREALKKIASIVTDKDLKRECRLLTNGLFKLGVTGPKPGRAEEPLVECIGIQDAADRNMVEAARLAYQLVLPTEADGNKYLYNIDRSENSWLRDLFEKAVGGCYKFHIGREDDWRVKTGTMFKWPINANSKTKNIDEILPQMKTDIMLTSEKYSHRVIIDTKYAAIITSGQYREVLKSTYIYQIYSYLRTQDNDHFKCSTGILLHPVFDIEVEEAVTIQQNDIMFYTINLMDEEAWGFKERLLKIFKVAAERKVYCHLV